MSDQIASRALGWAERPAVLSGIGRLFGLGQVEQQALTGGKFPRWAMVVVALGAGVVAGAYAQRKWKWM